LTARLLFRKRVAAVENSGAIDYSEEPISAIRPMQDHMESTEQKKPLVQTSDAKAPAGRPVERAIVQKRTVTAQPGQQRVALQPADSAFDYSVLLRALRGRVLVVSLLAIVGGTAGGILGWRWTLPIYQGEGLVRIAYSLPSIMKQTDQNGPIAMYETFLRSQQLAMQSRRIIQLGLNDRAWQATGLGTSSRMINEFAEGLTVDHPANTENLRVTFNSPDPIVAAAGVKSIIDVFAADYDHYEAELQTQRLAALDDRDKELSVQLAALNDKVDLIAKEFGGADLDHLYDTKDQQLLALMTDLSEVRLELASGKGDTQDKSGGPSSLPVLEVASTPEEIAETDPIMRSYLVEQTNSQDALARIRREAGDFNPSVVNLENELELIQQHIDSYLDKYRALHAPSTRMSGSQPVLVSRDPAAEPSIEAVKAKESALAAAYEQARAELPNLVSKRREVSDLKNQINRTRQALEEVAQRRESLRVESAAGGRLEVISTGEVPLTPTVDHRRQATFSGALIGAVAPISLLTVFGLLRRRYRYSDEAMADREMGELELLGALPALRDNESDSSRCADSARSIHQIRVRLQLAQQAEKGNVYLVTSATAGEGKTSIAASLALSFAATGARTLIIDFDLIGHRLTSRLGAEWLPGLWEGLNTGRLHTRQITPNLMLMGTGAADARHSGTLAVKWVRRLIDVSRSQYDAIIVDSGPLLGSIETSIIAGEANGIALVVSRGQKPQTVKQAIQRLTKLRAQVTGVIFNRATTADFNNSYSVSSSARSESSVGMDVGNESRFPELNLGPLVRSVIRNLPSQANAN
jgi:polysaccharide biosynthesis transport protein